MAIKTTQAKFDTCQCVIHFSFDDTTPEATRIHTISNVLNRCPAHAAMSDSTLFTTLLEENPRKNDTLKHILANSPTTALYDTVDGNRQLKSTITFNFSWSGTAPNRVLTVSFTGITLTTTQKNNLQTALNTRFGSGRVLIV